MCDPLGPITVTKEAGHALIGQAGRANSAVTTVPSKQDAFVGNAALRVGQQVDCSRGAVGLRVEKRGQEPGVSWHCRVWGFWNSPLGLWAALGRKLQTAPSLVHGFPGRLACSFSLISFLPIFLPVTRLFPTLLKMV